MSNVPSTALNLQNVPAHIAARIAARAQAGGKSSVADAIVGDGDMGPRVSIKAGRYRLVEAGVETVVGITLDTVIVGANPRVSKVFYDKAYDANATDARPACFSHDGISPDSSVAQPVHSNCTSCPNNVLGSKILPSGAKSKMCADQRHLAIVPAQDPSKVYSITVPVSGMKALREYFKDLTNYGIGPEEVVTELGFDANASFPKMTFKQKGYVPESAIGKVDALVASDEVKMATRQIPPTMANRAALPSAAAGQQALTSSAPAPAPAPAPAVDDAYEDEAVAAAPAPAPAPAPIQGTAAPAAKPTANPVSVPSAELTAKLDSLFG